MNALWKRIRELSLERVLTMLLGVLWLIDGILQLQPAMFTYSFISSVLTPSMQGQPMIISQLVQFGIQLFETNLLFTNSLSALIQLVIGILLILPLSRHIQRYSLLVSIAWAIIVWVFGEGVGGVFTGSASFYTGAPGSALLYAVLAVVLLFPRRLSPFLLPKVAGALFLIGALLNCFPMYWQKGMQTMLVQLSLQDASSTVSAPAKYILLIASSAVMANIVAIGMLLVLGALLLFTTSRVVGWISIVFLFVVWWIAQDFGGVFTFPFGTATDPNTAPLVALFLLPLWYTRKKVRTRGSSLTPEFLTVVKRVNEQYGDALKELALK